MSSPSPPVPPQSGNAATGNARHQRRQRALERAVELAVRAPSVHNTQPWHMDVHADRLGIRADRTRQLTVLDPMGRELVQSVGAALFNARVALAADGWAVDVERLPDPADPDLLAVVRPVPGAPDPALAGLASAVARRRTNRRAFGADRVPDHVLRRLTASTAEEGALLVPVLTESHRRLVARLTQQADREQNASPAYRAELRQWTNRRRNDGDGVPTISVPHVDGRQHDDLPLRDFDTRGEGALPPETSSGTDQTLVLLATRTDDEGSWLHCGEAMQRVLLELTEMGWAASPLTQPVEVPLTRMQVRSALTWDAHPQLMLRIGRAAGTPPTPRRSLASVLGGNRSAEQPAIGGARDPATPSAPERG
jgi:nitroreductase